VAQISKADLVNMRIEHVSSLLRPEWLKDLFARHRAGGVSEEELRAGEDRAIREVIGKQETAGFPVVTDGEYRRFVFSESATNTLAGLVEGMYQGGVSDTAAIRAGSRYETPAEEQQGTTARIALRRNLPLEEYRFSQQVATRPVKVAILGPDRLMRRQRREPFYTSDDAYGDDFVAAYRQMVGELVAAGCRYIQIDGPEYTAYVDPPSLERMRAHGEDPEQSLARAIAMDNAIMAGFPDVTFGLHICRGNRSSMYHREGSYDAIAERLFGSSNYDRFLLEYDTERSGGFEPLRFVPKGRTAVLGLVTTKFPDVEPADDLKAQLEEASRFLGSSQLALSPQCGFASSLSGNLLDEDAQWRKLEVIREVSEQVWT
jgi:5-methyltetrahydropteroyltriglutamate--homocysteine methyltransferase